MENKYADAFSEVYEIIKIIPTELSDKISNEFKEVVNKNRNLQYTPKIEKPEEVEGLRDETKIILGYIYREFIVDKEERDEIRKEDEKKFQELYCMLEKEKKEKYGKINLFPNSNIKTSQKEQDNNKEESKESKELVIAEAWYQKIITGLKKFFKRIFD